MPTPILTYYSFDTGDPTYKYGFQLVYNPIVNEIWTHFNFLADNPTGDDLVRVSNYTPIGTLVGQSVLTSGGTANYTRDGFPDFYDSVTNAIIFRVSAGGQKILSVNATTEIVTPHSTNNYFTWAYNTYASGALRCYGLRSSSIQWDTVDLATGTGTAALTVLPPGETFFNTSLVFSSSSVAWMMRQFTASNKLDKYNLSTGLITATYTVPGAVTTALWLAYCPVNNSIYIAAETTDNSAVRWIERFDIGSTTFSTVWTDPTAGFFRWKSSTDSAPILNYDSYRNLIWFNDGPDGAFGSFAAIVALDCATNTELYRFFPTFPDDTQTPWKYTIAPDSIWISENNLASFNQLLRISFAATPGAEQPRIFVTLP